MTILLQSGVIDSDSIRHTLKRKGKNDKKKVLLPKALKNGDSLFYNKPIPSTKLWYGRYSTPYLNSRLPIDVVDISDTKELLHPDTAYDVPHSNEFKQFYKAVQQKLYGSDDIPPHRKIIVNPEDEHEKRSVNEGLVDLVVTIPSELNNDLHMKSNYEQSRIRNFRWEEDYINSRVYEDSVCLFDTPNLDTTKPVFCQSRKSEYIEGYDPHKYYDPDEFRLLRWADINQGRYFWDFIDQYGSGQAEVVRSCKESKKKIKAKLKQIRAKEKIELEEEIEANKKICEEEDIARQKMKYPSAETVVIPFKFLESIFPEDLPSICKPQGDKIIPSHRIYDFGLEIERICGNAPLIVDLKKQAGKSFHKRIDHVDEIMEVYREPELPAGFKSFEDTYPSLSAAALAAIQKEKEQELLKTSAIGALSKEKAAVRKIAGGRYAIR